MDQQETEEQTVPGIKASLPETILNKESYL
jgi:hypothetical protein